MVPLDLDVDGGDGGRDEDGGDKGEDVHGPHAKEGVGRGEQAEEGEPPLDLVDDERLALLGELVDDESEQEQVDEGPHVERIGRRGDVGLLDKGRGEEGGRGGDTLVVISRGSRRR